MKVLKKFTLIAFLSVAVLSVTGFEWEYSSSVNGSNRENGFLYGHEYVDLGLPSGTVWATCNVGTNRPEGWGDLFAWGETKEKDDVYKWETYKYSMGFWSGVTLTKYCNKSSCGYKGFTDNYTTLLPCDDAATANWGNGWRTPTSSEWTELIDNTSQALTSRNGVTGLQFTATNGKTLFLPGTDPYNHYDFENRPGIYWSSSLTMNPYRADIFTFINSWLISDQERSLYGSVRPVHNKP